jgi:hypothetical protein
MLLRYAYSLLQAISWELTKVQAFDIKDSVSSPRRHEQFPSFYAKDIAIVRIVSHFDSVWIKVRQGGRGAHRCDERPLGGPEVADRATERIVLLRSPFSLFYIIHFTIQKKVNATAEQSLYHTLSMCLKSCTCLINVTQDHYLYSIINRGRALLSLQSHLCRPCPDGGRGEYTAQCFSFALWRQSTTTASTRAVTCRAEMSRQVQSETQLSRFAVPKQIFRLVARSAVHIMTTANQHKVYTS